MTEASFCIKMCTIKFSEDLNTFGIDDKDLNTNNIRAKSEQIFKMDDSLVSHPPIYVRFLDDSPVRHPLSKVLTGWRKVNKKARNYIHDGKHLLNLST